MKTNDKRNALFLIFSLNQILKRFNFSFVDFIHTSIIFSFKSNQMERGILPEDLDKSEIKKESEIKIKTEKVEIKNENQGIKSEPTHVKTEEQIAEKAHDPLIDLFYSEVCIFL